MFYHVKELEFNARVTSPDPRFATLLLEQFGGGNGELKAAMQYFVQAFTCKKPFPDKYDLLMDIATEELSHLEIVGATITMLLDGINGEMKNAVENTYLANLMKGSAAKEQMMNQMLPVSPAFMALTGGGPALTDSNGFPWIGHYVNANGDPTVDLRSNIAAESRAKVVYEYLIQLTDDPMVKETLGFLMTREIAHFNQFAAALETIQPNFPPAVLQGDPRFTHVYVNASESGEAIRGPWNEGQGPWPKGEQWVYVENPVPQVQRTEGMINQPVEGTKMTPKMAQQLSEKLSKQRSQEVTKAVQANPGQWSEYNI